MGKKRAKLLSEQIRAAVDDSSLSRYRICKILGINQGLMSRFMAGKSGLLLRNLDALCELLELELIKRKAR